YFHTSLWRGAFFFSSRRRHTRFSRDWSSDVCSSDLEVAAALKFDAARLQDYLAAKVPDFACLLAVNQFKGGQSNPTYLLETATRDRKSVVKGKSGGLGGCWTWTRNNRWQESRWSCLC